MSRYPFNVLSLTDAKPSADASSCPWDQPLSLVQAIRDAILGSPLAAHSSISLRVTIHAHVFDGSPDGSLMVTDGSAAIAVSAVAARGVRRRRPAESSVMSGGVRGSPGGGDFLTPLSKCS